MKISKKLLSLVLCMVMLLSTTAYASMTSAPQTDAKDLAWFTEPFSASGQSMTQRGVATTANESLYKTVGTFDYVLKDGTTDDYVLNLSVAKTSATTTNYAGVRKTATTGTYFPLADGIFSVSYDICFKSAPASGVVFRISGQNVNQAGSKPWGIGRTIFEGVSDNDKHIGLWDEHTDYEIDLNKWYSVKHLFDTKVGYEYMTVTDDTGVEIQISPQQLSASLLDAAGVYMIELHSWEACEYSIDNITLKDESVSLETAADTFLATDDVTLTATIPEGFDKAVVMADGNVMGQIAPVAGKNIYDVTIPANELGVGNHELILSASYDDGMTRTNATTVTITNEYETGVSGSITHPTSVQTFNHLFDSENMTHSDSILIIESEKGSTISGTDWQSNKPTYIVPGPSGVLGDYGISIVANGGLLQIRGLTNPPISKGTLVVELDMLLGGSAVNVQSDMIYGTSANPAYTAAGNFINQNKILSTIPVEEKTWTHVKMVYDDSIKTMTVYANGQSASIMHENFNYLTTFRFTLKSSNVSFAVDNARIYNLVTDPVINSAAYVTADGETATTGAIPANATALKLTMSEALTVTADDVELYADNEPITASNVESADGVVTITLPTLSANKDLKVVLKNSIDGLGSALTQNLYVTDASGNFFKNSGVVTANGEKTAVIRHMGSGTSKAIAATYSGNELVAIKVYDFKSVSGIGAVNVSVPVANADSVKFMAWDTLSSATPKITSPLYNVD